MLRQSPHCSGVGMLRQSPHCSAGWGCYEIVPTAVQEVVKVTVKHNGENSIHSSGSGAVQLPHHVRSAIAVHSAALGAILLKREEGKGRGAAAAADAEFAVKWLY